MKYITKLAEILDRHGKRKMFNHLRVMSDRQLIDCGFSPELLSAGIKAWPWRELPNSVAPLKFDEAFSISAASEKTKVSDKSAEKSISLQQDAA